MKLILKEQTLFLLAQRAVFWQERELLIVADIHLGKAATLQKAGLAIPVGAMEEDLKALAVLIDLFKAKRCLIVGDLIHAKSGLSSDVQERFRNWRQEQPCTFDLILGNHDKALRKQLPEEWNLHVHDHQLLIPPFGFCHIPTFIPSHFVWSGHIHPKISLRSQKESLHLPCFQFFEHLAILPAFSCFVGGVLVKPEKNSRIFATAGQDVFEVPYHYN